MIRISVGNLIFTIGVVLFVICFSNLAYKITRQDKIETYSEALTTATRDATMLLIDIESEDAINTTYEGYMLEPEDVPVDYEGVLDQFYKSLWINLGIEGEREKAVFKGYIPLKGVVGYSSLRICSWNDVWYPPVPYVYYDDSSDVLYMFTLGDKVWYREEYTGATGWVDISSVPIPSSEFTPKAFRDYIIMRTINEELSKLASSELNIVSRNNYRGVKFMLPRFDTRNAGNGEDYYNWGNIFEEPGVFAMIDGVMVGLDRKPISLASFGGAELRFVE